MATDRGLRTRKQLGNAIKTELWYALHDLHESSRIDKSKLLDEAVEDLLIKHDRRDLIDKYKADTK